MSDLIVVDITENEKILLDGSLNLKELTGNGKPMQESLITCRS